MSNHLGQIIDIDQLRGYLTLIGGTVAIVTLSASRHGDISKRMRLLTKELRETPQPDPTKRTERLQKQIGIFRNRCNICAIGHICLNLALVVEVGLLAWKLLYGVDAMNYWTIIICILFFVWTACNVSDLVLGWITTSVETEDVPCLPSKSIWRFLTRSRSKQSGQKQPKKRGTSHGMAEESLHGACPPGLDSETGKSS
jgi:hypothetical protein